MKLIAFDWDQTLWDGWGLHVKGVQKTAEELGFPGPTEDGIISSFSVPFSGHLENLFPHNTQEAIRRYLEFYHANVRKKARLYPGVPEMLQALRQSGYLVALFSDKANVYGDTELEQAGIPGLFAHVLFQDGGRAHKPDPEGLRRVMDALSVAPDQVVYVGDSHVDVECARRTGATSAAALWGSINAEAALRAGPDYVFHGVADVLTALGPEGRLA